MPMRAVKVLSLGVRLKRFQRAKMLNINARTGRAFDVRFLLLFFVHLLKFVLVVEFGLDKFI